MLAFPGHTLIHCALQHQHLSDSALNEASSRILCLTTEAACQKCCIRIFLKVLVSLGCLCTRRTQVVDSDVRRACSTCLLTDLDRRLPVQYRSFIVRHCTLHTNSLLLTRTKTDTYIFPRLTACSSDCATSQQCQV